ncbi:outer membrane protein assembly factor BamB family protein [Streptomyces siamensis]|uniref:Pyrrolo-quinoline quinone repeat domain-containing protein n=1 Tax=Streptomyces siamensis TaxID=1274986 RepID=A0ABP9JQS6_9ACTN
MSIVPTAPALPGLSAVPAPTALPRTVPAVAPPGAGRRDRSGGGRSAVRAFLPVALVFLLVVPLLVAAHTARSTPFGDRLTVHARGEHGPRPALRARGATVEAYDAVTGRPRWTYAREGRRPLSVLPARGDAIALWDDGLVTATARDDGRAVRWHRALPDAAPWLAGRGGAGVLRVLGPRVLAVVTPRRVAAYRLADGDLRWVLPAHPGCAFAPARAVRHDGALLIAQPCATADDWTAEIVAVDELGRITPDRAPLGGVRRGEHHSAEHPHAEKVLARPR